MRKQQQSSLKRSITLSVKYDAISKRIGLPYISINQVQALSGVTMSSLKSKRALTEQVSPQRSNELLSTSKLVTNVAPPNRSLNLTLPRAEFFVETESLKVQC